MQVSSSTQNLQLTLQGLVFQITFTRIMYRKYHYQSHTQQACNNTGTTPEDQPKQAKQLAGRK